MVGAGVSEQEAERERSTLYSKLIRGADKRQVSSSGTRRIPLFWILRATFHNLAASWMNEYLPAADTRRLLDLLIRCIRLVVLVTEGLRSEDT